MTAPRMYMGANMLLLVNGDGTPFATVNGVTVELERVPVAELVTESRDLWPTDADRMKSVARAGYEANRAAVQ